MKMEMSSEGEVSLILVFNAFSLYHSNWRILCIFLNNLQWVGVKSIRNFASTIKAFFVMKRFFVALKSNLTIIRCSDISEKHVWLL